MFNAFLLAADPINQLWYALPLVVVGSLVYAATRHEEMGPIVRLAVRSGLLIALIMGILFVILYAMSWWNSQ